MKLSRSELPNQGEHAAAVAVPLPVDAAAAAAVLDDAAATVADGEADVSEFSLYYDNDRMVPRAITVRRPDGTDVQGVKRIVIEVTQDRLPTVLAMELS
jgi:hypothetical protein